LGELRVTTLLNDVFSVMRRHHLHLPANLALLVKTVIMIEGLGVTLDPQFELAKSLAIFADGLVLRQYSPSRLVDGLGRAGFDLAKLGVEIPQHLRRIVSAAEDGNLQIGVRPEGFDLLIDRIEKIANRLVLGVIAAAFINGLAVLVSVYKPPGWRHLSWIAFFFGFVCALLLGAYLAWSIVRPKRR
jgi:ubiquinone biosynthesis protein